MRRPSRKLCLLLAPALLAGCATPETKGGAAANLTNPVLDADFPDPAVLRASDGFYYAYATQGGGDGGPIHNIQAARSRDLARWERLGDVLPVKPRWAARTQDFWAPHVTEHRGRFFLYYSAKPDVALADPKRGLCLAVAVADRPTGPFTDVGAPLQCGEGFVNIDPMAYDDPATGKRLLYWGSGFGPIKVRELRPDRVSFVPGGPTIDLVQPVRTEDPREYARLIEGAWVVRRGGWYYLFYSGDNCCGPKAHYAVMVARSRSATGPFERHPTVEGRSRAILEADARWIAPGHNSIATDARGNDWIVYHAVDRRRPRAKPADEVNSRRVMLIARVDWRDGWPRVAAPGTPAQTR